MFESGDPSNAKSLISSDKDILGIGTDPDEWWAGDAFFQAMNAQVPEMYAAGMRFELGDDVQAFSEGSVGWVAARPTLKLPDGSGVPMRFTSVWHQEAGDWKAIQVHVSVGVSNETALGEHLTT
jgi:hypothetical protein